MKVIPKGYKLYRVINEEEFYSQLVIAPNKDIALKTILKAETYWPQLKEGSEVEEAGFICSWDY